MQVYLHNNMEDRVEFKILRFLRALSEHEGIGKVDLGQRSQPPAFSSHPQVVTHCKGKPHS